jgi:hypothetical protein
MPIGLEKSLLFPEIKGRIRYIKEAYERTTAWLRQTRSYRLWRDLERPESHKGLLWIKGKPASGKSTAMKSAMTYEQESCLVASFFFDSKGGHLQRTAIGMFRSLVYQLAKSDEIICKALSDSWTHNVQDVYTSSYNWRLAELESFLEDVVKLPLTQPIFLFIDGLDECDKLAKANNTCGGACDAVEFFQGLLTRANEYGTTLRICLSSRTSFVYGNQSNSLVLDQENKASIETYARIRFENYRDTLTTRELHTVSTDIANRASGIFLWAKLVVDVFLEELDSGKTVK